MTTYDLCIEYDADTIWEHDLDEDGLRAELHERGYTAPAANDMDIDDVIDQVEGENGHVEVIAYE